jgi:hypothetical protein
LDKIPVAREVQPRFGRISVLLARLGGDSRVPPPAFGEDVAQQHGIIGHHAVGPEVKGPGA